MSNRRYEQPQARKRDGVMDTTETHPAYGMISASRVASNPGEPLFGSDFRHGHYMWVTISHGMVNRGLSKDWYHDGQLIARVAMSESQWATFISTPNSGAGSPCTLDWIVGKGEVAKIPNPPERHEQFSGELAAALQEALGHLKELERLTRERPGAKKDIEHRAFMAHKAIRDSAPWVGKMFGEHMENAADRAKTEISAYLEAAIARRGLKALGAASAVQLTGTAHAFVADDTGEFCLLCGGRPDASEHVA